MKEVSERLKSVINGAEPRLRQIVVAETSKPILPGGWSRRQVMGHLIDSASNNHQRFVRAAQQATLEFPGYDQTGNVRVQAPQEATTVTWRMSSRACRPTNSIQSVGSALANRLLWALW